MYVVLKGGRLKYPTNQARESSAAPLSLLLLLATAVDQSCS